MDNKQAIEELKKIKQNYIKFNYNFRHLDDDYIVAIDKAMASLEAWDKFYDEIEELLDKRYCEKEGKVQDNLAEGFLQSEKAIKRRIKEIKKEIEECL